MKTFLKSLAISFCISGGLLLVWTAQAAEGDAIYVKKHTGPAVKLSSSSKTLIGQAVKSVWPAIPLADFDGERCTLDLETAAFGCVAWQEVALTDSEYLDLDLAGELDCPKQTSTKKKLGVAELDEAQLVKHEAFTQEAFGLSLSNVAWYQCRRDASASNVVYCKYREVITAGPDVYRQDRVAGNVYLLIGKVD